MGDRAEGRSSGNSGCFASGTLVNTPEGARDISTLRKDDWVVTLDADRDGNVSRRIMKVVRKRNTLCEITFAGGHTIRTTASHSLCVNGAWKKVAAIKAGDLLLCVDGRGKVVAEQVAKVSQSDKPEDVFNIVVDGSFTFVADGVFAHSFSNFRRIRVLGWLAYSAICEAWQWISGVRPARTALTARGKPA